MDTINHTNFPALLLDSLQQHRQNNAFCIEDTYFTYQQLADKVAAIRQSLQRINDIYIGLVANNDLATYAAILAIWMEGKCYVPLHPLQPIARCVNIIEQVGIKVVLDSGTDTRYHNQYVIHTGESLPSASNLHTIQEFNSRTPAYILFTSGSTGMPKGVPVSYGNVSAFIQSVEALGIHHRADDRCLQMFDLTFDLSVGCYLLPLLAGACVYTMRLGCIKWEESFRLLDEYALTITFMVPSVIHYLKPYLQEIEAPQLRYSLFAGEALTTDDTLPWQQAVPQAEIWNVYGPTENTIYCTGYRLPQQQVKQHNNIISIGQTMKWSDTMIVDEARQPVNEGTIGELCLSGEQLTPGYWQDNEKNQAAFFNHEGRRWYLTGDLCMADRDGDIMYLGRKDSQVKIQGYRIELSEIESVTRRFYNRQTAVVAVVTGQQGRETISMAIEREDDHSCLELEAYLKTYLPSYMIPSKIVFMPTFPQNMSNKIDRKRIKELIK
ncbi:amino acid adenylation domain-containing protein [Prevotella sp. A2931]|uniref:Amino acid adenylation domain-containing protein n=1 Tax=Prevotella illustrans TaxID=2800387 RepID=A0ABS3M627_9BACT|nr:MULTISPECIES: amino acid adenylation domain-containing protein [Prevotella]MBO1363632.1 amino acid adenylation domain-containing protein [Prevotella illustrans]PTL27217.1 peptide synthase [Prevotella sp. oral taxon 820]